ncbi:MAG: polyprenyl synthetase family protein [Candidatus Aminicenantes bacterium]|nr:polyprenyl synthetase family protein [Candidatus Aminicenantes bacterium]
MTWEIKNRLQEIKQKLETYMRRFLEGEESALYSAMRYAVLSEGKRYRPLLLICTGERFGASHEVLLPFACAIEFIHNYSLIHDDLPSMDNDDWRRGQPSCHRAFGEDVALLAGDSLLTLAFEVMSEAPMPPELVSRKLEAMAEISRLSGPKGMIAGQFMDIKSSPAQLSEDQMIELMEKKTGALIVASVKVGAILGGASPEALLIMEDFGRRLGLAFQIRDDILDSRQPIKSKLFRPNYVHLVGPEKASLKLQSLVFDAIDLLQKANLLTAEIKYLSFKLLELN